MYQIFSQGLHVGIKSLNPTCLKFKYLKTYYLINLCRYSSKKAMLSPKCGLRVDSKGHSGRKWKCSWVSTHMQRFVTQVTFEDRTQLIFVLNVNFFLSLIILISFHSQFDVLCEYGTFNIPYGIFHTEFSILESHNFSQLDSYASRYT